MDDAQALEGMLASLAEQAWLVRDRAFIVGDTRVGAAVQSADGRVFVGCNVEHRYRCHDVHAEVNAITSMIAAGARNLVAVVVVAERERFTPCGGCLDWIFQFGNDDCVVAYQTHRGGPIRKFRASELMPYYPK